MILKNEVLLKHNKEWLHFANPHQIISTASIDDVHAALQEVEQLINENNWHAAGFVSYEAAPAFDSALHVQSSDNFPLYGLGYILNPAPYRPPRS